MRAAQVVAEGDNAAPSALAGLPESADAGSAGGACGGMGETGEDGGIPSAEQVEAEGTSSDAPESPDGVGLSTADRREADRVLAKRAVGDAVECHVRLEAPSGAECRETSEMLDKIPDREHLVSKFEVQSVEGGSSGDSSRLDDVNGPAVLATPDRLGGADQQNEEEGRGNDEEEIRAKHVDPKKWRGCHHRTCDRCGYRSYDISKQRARKPKDDDVVREELLYCQTCAASYHPTCSIPWNKSAEADSFRCKTCIKDPPRCLVCADPPASVEDPLFRCSKCALVSHDECLHKLTDDEDQPNYRKDWHCPYCVIWTDPVDRVLTYRDSRFDPEHGIDVLSLHQLSGSPSEPECPSGEWREYLVKFKNRSYRDVEWVPSRWLVGTVSRAMLKNFWTACEGPVPEDEAFSEAYTRIDIVLCIRDEDGDETEDPEIEPDQISAVYVKWKKLPYDEANWTEPPDEDEPEYANFLSAFERYKKALGVGKPKRSVQLNSRMFKELVDQPRSVEGGSLMPHQMEGLNWLLYKYYSNDPCILADDMGLGKTIQIISLLSIIFDRHGFFPFLIVVPNSTLENWVREFRKWAPRLVVVGYSARRPDKDIIKKHLLFAKKGKNAQLKFHVLVGTYEMAASELSTLKKAGPYEMLVVDEGQRLKADSTKLLESLNEVSVQHKVLLTGTPLQNNVREMFNLMRFLDAKTFPDPRALEKKYTNLDDQAVAEVKGMLESYILRRTKQNVLKDLPPVTEIIVPVSMTPFQKTVYKGILSKNVELLQAISASEGSGRPVRHKSLHNILMELRKCLNHPYLCVHAPSGNSVEQHQDLIAHCGKLRFLHDLLKQLKSGGHRVLIFSQMKLALDILEDYLAHEDYRYLRFDGDTPQDARQERIDVFNDDNSDVFVFLISTRAGGVGVNLATADTVIIYDADFNPHQDLQALSRAHRIGQSKKVLVLKLMTRGSAEERIMQVAKKKLILDHLIIESLGKKGDEEETSDVASVLKFGAKALFEEDDDSSDKAIKYGPAEISALLVRREDAANSNDAVADSGGQFGFARIWVNDHAEEQVEEEAVDDTHEESFWTKIVEERRKRKAEMEGRSGRGTRKRMRANYEEADDGAESSPLAPKKPRVPEVNEDEYTPAREEVESVSDSEMSSERDVANETMRDARAMAQASAAALSKDRQPQKPTTGETAMRMGPGSIATGHTATHVPHSNQPLFFAAKAPLTSDGFNARPVSQPASAEDARWADQVPSGPTAALASFRQQPDARPANAAGYARDHGPLPPPGRPAASSSSWSKAPASTPYTQYAPYWASPLYVQQLSSALQRALQKQATGGVTRATRPPSTAGANGYGPHVPQRTAPPTPSVPSPRPDHRVQIIEAALSEYAYNVNRYWTTSGLPTQPAPRRGRCANCQTTQSHTWRHGERASGLLCDECGLYFAKNHELRPVPVCWCCQKKHAGVCVDMSSAAKLLERRERVVRDAALQLSERAAILAKVDAALNSAKRESPQRPNHVLAPRLSSVTATAFPPCSSSSTSRAGPPLPAVPGSVAEGATGQQPPIAFHRHQLSFVVPSPGTGAGAAVPSRPATAPAVGAFPVSKSLAAASLITNSVPAFTGSGGPAGPIAGFFPGRCVICLQAGHVLSQCPSRANPSLVRLRYSQITADRTIPVAKRMEILSRLAIYLNNNVTIRAD